MLIYNVVQTWHLRIHDVGFKGDGKGVKTSNSCYRLATFCVDAPTLVEILSHHELTFCSLGESALMQV
jgi:hypothetical protein